MIKICFYCDSVFSVGGVQRILAVIAGAISAKHEVTILTNRNKKISICMNWDKGIFVSATSASPLSENGNICPAKHTVIYTKKESYHKSLSPHNGMDIAHSHTHNGKFSSVN